jgi:hypothetical protein
MENFWTGRRRLIDAIRFVEWFKRRGSINDPQMKNNIWFLEYCENGEDIMETINRALKLINAK